MNAEGESRCIRCGVALTAAPAPRLRGAAVPAPAPPAVVVPIQRKQRSVERPPQQQSLFRIIPFEAIGQPGKEAPSAKPPAIPATGSPTRTSRKRRPGQAELFPPSPEPAKEAPVSVKCRAPVAALGLRVKAIVIDQMIVAAAYVPLLAFARYLYGSFPLGLWPLAVYAGLYLLLLTWYKVLAAALGQCSPGLRWAGLRILQLSGRPPTPGMRLLRVLGGWVSLLTGGLGLLWPLVDAERLAIHDHVSETFVTPVDS